MRNLAACFALLFLVACAQLQPGGPYGKDTTLYYADVTITTGYEAIHSFVTWEYQNRTFLLRFPEVKKFADSLRREAPSMFETAFALREAYANAPTGTNADKLNKALAVIRTAMIEATQYLVDQQIK